MYWPQNHMVAPASEALECTECHSEDGRLDFAALGFPEDRIAVLTVFPPTEPETTTTTEAPTTPTTEAAPETTTTVVAADEVEDESSSSGLIVGIIIGVVVLGGLGFVALRRRAA